METTNGTAPNPIIVMTVTKATAKPGQGYGGPPLKFPDPVEFARKVDAYFDHCQNTIITKQVVSAKEIVKVETPTPPTMAGLAAWLGISRFRLLDYDDDEAKSEYSGILSRARLRIEESNITMGLLGCHDTRISQLNLASNFGYVTNKQEIDVTQTTHHTIEVIDAQIRQLLQDNPDLIEMVRNPDSGDDSYESDDSDHNL